MTKKVKIGLIGLGSMGSTHLDIYSKINDVEVIAIADSIQSRLDGSIKAEGNISGQAEGGVIGLNVKKYLDGMDLINNPDIDAVDICVGTDLHFVFVEAALAKNKHVLVEKPLARTYDEAKKIIQLAKLHSSCHVMSAMCLRYWPAWVFLKEVIENNAYGKCLSLNFKRQTSFPGGAFYSDSNQCGGALLDLHVHDTDFINYCLGLPDAVFSQGYKGPSGDFDHVVTNYIFNNNNSPLVSSEGSWTMQEGYGFNMSYTANFENGTLSYLLDEDEILKLFISGSDPEVINLKEGMGYEFEIRTFVAEILSGNKTNFGLLQQAAKTIAIIEAEGKSIEKCSIEPVKT